MQQISILSVCGTRDGHRHGDRPGGKPAWLDRLRLHAATVRFEHFALNVADARAAAAWYVEHLGFTIVRALTDSPFTHFLADDSGRTVLEVYTNPAAPVPDYRRQHWLVQHFAVVSRDVDADRLRLEQAGATLATIDDLPDGSRLIMLRDPWGMCVQLCRRAKLMP